MSKSRSRLGDALSLLLTALLFPGLAAAQAVTGTISGTVVDAQGQVVPGATVTVINEATADSRAATSDAQGDFQVTNLQPGRYTAPGRAAELPHARAQEHRPQRRRAPGGRRTSSLEVGGIGETVVGRSHAARTSTPRRRSTAASSPRRRSSRSRCSGRDVTSIMRLLPGVRYENTVDSLGMSFGTSVPNVGGARRDWSNVIVDGVVGQRGRRQRPDGAADQPRRDRRGPRAAELLPRRVRPRRRRAGADRQQERHARPTTATSTTTCRNEALNANNFFNNRSNIKKPRYRFNTFGANLGGPVPGLNKAKEAVLLLLAGGAAREPARARAELDDADRSRDAGRLLADARQPGPPDQHQGSAGDRARATPSRGGPACFPGNIIPAEPHQLERPGAAEHAAARQQLRSNVHAGAVQLHDAGERREPEDEQHRARRLAAVGDTTASTSRSRTGTRISAAARSPPGPNKWGFFNTHYLNTDRGVSANYTKIIRSNHGARHRLRDPSADRAVLSADRGGLEPDQSRHRRLHRRAVPSRAESAQRHPEGQLQRARTRRTSRSTTGWSIRARRG